MELGWSAAGWPGLGLPGLAGWSLTSWSLAGGSLAGRILASCGMASGDLVGTWSWHGLIWLRAKTFLKSIFKQEEPWEPES